MSNLSYSLAYLHAVPGLEFDATSTSVRLLLETLHACCHPRLQDGALAAAKPPLRARADAAGHDSEREHPHKH